MTDRNESRGQQDLSADDATLAFNALRQTIEKLADNLDAEISIIRKGVEAAFDRLDDVSRQPDYCDHFEQLADDMVLIAEHVKMLEKTPALRYGPDDYGRMFEVVADRMIVSLSRVRSGGSSDVGSLAIQLRELMHAARDRRQQDRWLMIAGIGGLLLGGLLMLVLVRQWPTLFFELGRHAR